MAAKKPAAKKADGRGKQGTAPKPSTGTSADRRLAENRAAGQKKPGPTPGTASAKKGSAAGGRASPRKR